jgi:hypothetical protein
MVREPEHINVSKSPVTAYAGAGLPRKEVANSLKASAGTKPCGRIIGRPRGTVMHLCISA